MIIIVKVNICLGVLLRAHTTIIAAKPTLYNHPKTPIASAQLEISYPNAPKTTFNNSHSSKTTFASSKANKKPNLNRDPRQRITAAQLLRGR